MEDWPVSNSNVYQISLKTSNCRSDASITYSEPKKKAKLLFCSICNDLINDIYILLIQDHVLPYGRQRQS